MTSTSGVCCVEANHAKDIVAVTHDNHIRFFKLSTGELLTQAEAPDKDEVIRCLLVTDDGSFFISAGDSKNVVAWCATTLQMVSKSCLPKKLTACAFVEQNRALVVSTKFGDVYRVGLVRGNTLELGKPQLLFGHYSIVTDIASTVDGRFICTADRDEKIRVTRCPGYMEIQSFCLGHTEFVSRVCALTHKGVNLLVTGSGDLTVRLWNLDDGALLHTATFESPQQETTKDESPTPATTTTFSQPHFPKMVPDTDAISISALTCDSLQDASIVAVAVEDDSRVRLFQLVDGVALQELVTLSCARAVTDLSFVTKEHLFVGLCTGQVEKWHRVDSNWQREEGGALGEPFEDAENSAHRVVPVEYRRKYNHHEDWDVQEKIVERIQMKKQKVFSDKV
eukprot:c12168_g1_i1.p1 GENE.c12168_g1_i1~~c12168_g1_i1.p1  ORF type:complete len:403 (-),score=93.17 c12168_g1_i1:1137-2321(-)